MAWKDRLVDAMRAGLVLNERVLELGRKIERLDSDVRDIDRRVIRIEAFMEISATRQQRLPPE
ncbi:MAG: hypothetical protein ACR2RB_12815 [Gammaproteobacteria bacterium]